MRAVILKNPGETYDILLHAYDSDNDVSDNPVRLRFMAQGPQKGEYPVGQNPADGDFTVSGDKKKLRVGNRLDTDQAITFGTGGGFTFAGLAAVVQELERRVPSDHDHTSSTVTVCDPLSGPLANWKDQDGVVLGTGCYSVSSNTKDVEIVSLIDPVGSPVLTFKLPSEHRGLNETSGATITITYHVVALINPLPDEDGLVDERTEGGRRVKSFRESLSLDIHKCVNATNCP